MFSVKFINDRTKATIRFYPDRSPPTTDVLPGLNITGDTDGNVVVTLPSIQQNDTGVYILTSPGFSQKCNCLYMLGKYMIKGIFGILFFLQLKNSTQKQICNIYINVRLYKI
jgi:hypothetical protein